MDQEKIAEGVFAKVAGKGEEYRKYFEKKLKKWNVKSPSEIPDDKKDDFFEEVDKGWNSEDEKGKDGKKASDMDGLVSLRDRRARQVRAGAIGPESKRVERFVDSEMGRLGKLSTEGEHDEDKSLALNALFAAHQVIEKGKPYKTYRLSGDYTAGCEKLPEGAMRDNCEKKKKDKKEKKAIDEGILEIFKGKYFEADLIDMEALDVYMTKQEEGGVFSRSEVAMMIKELKAILKADARAR